MPVQKESRKRYEFRIRPLGLTLWLSRRGVRLSRTPPEVEDIRARAEQWFLYCHSVHRR